MRVRDHSGVPIEFRPVDAAAPPARDLLADMVAEMDALYGAAEPGDGIVNATPADFRGPRGTFLVGFEDGRPLCAGGLKPLGDDVAEVKRMFVVPDARRRGVARALLRALEDAGRELGHRVLRLDTGPGQPHAWALYRAEGFQPIDDYNANPLAAYWGEKAL
jgi:GNAT superfamily N-acetyltransferase